MATKRTIRPDKSLTQILKKIPLFEGLSPTGIQKILGLCSPEAFAPEKQICTINAPSDRLHILLSGELAVITSDGLRVATISPITTIGEMGFITRHPCSATVEVTKPSNILVIQKNPFDQILRNDRDMLVAIYRNIIDILSTKLIKDNVRTRDYLLEKAQYESRLEDKSGRIDIALRLLVERGDMDLDEAQSCIDEEVIDKRPRILVVDDEEPVRRMLKEILGTFVVMEAGTGQEALELAQKQKPNLVITDIKMPKMDGIGLLHHLRDLYEDLPVLATSGIVDSDDIQDQLFDGFIAKPMDLQEIKRMVDESLMKAEASEQTDP